MKTWRSIRLRRFFVLTGIVCSGIIIACYGDDIASVHFHGSGFGDKTKYDFGRVPQEIIVAGWSNEPARGGTDNETGVPSFDNFYGEPLAESIRPGDHEHWYRSDDVKREVFRALQTALHHARNLEVSGRFREAAQAFRSASQAKRILSLAKDRKELSELGLNEKTIGYTQYLRARYLMEFGYEKQVATGLATLKGLHADPKLEPHVQYAIACAEDNVKGLRKVRSDAFMAIAEKYSTSKRAEAAMIMAARSNLEVNEWSKPDNDDWNRGIKIFDQFVAKYPMSRFLDNIEGWRGGYHLRQKNVLAAIPHFLKQSRSLDPKESWKGHQALAEIAQKEGRKTDAVLQWLAQRTIPLSAHFKVQSSRQIRDTFNGFTQTDAKGVQTKISGSPELLSAYVDFRLEDTKLSPQQERKLLKYVSATIGKLQKVDKKIYARMAQLQYSSGNYGQSLRFARLGRNADGDYGDRSRFIEASSLERLGNHRSAMSQYEELLRKLTRDYLHQACAEQLAFLSEKFGDPMRAYALYKEINYNEDLAFLVDSELSPSKIKKLIAKANTHSERSTLKYSLAMRYFRVGEYVKARRVLENLPKDLRMTFAGKIADQESDYSEKKVPIIDSLVDVNMMLRLRREADNARSQEKRGQDIYAMARYTNKRRKLMYYSWPLWEGSRATMYSIFWNDALNRGKFAKIAHSSAYEHECDAQTMKLCDEVIRRCPNSSVVPDALYSAGVAAEKLSRFNNYWDGFNDHLLGKASKYMKRVAKEYPHHRLAKSARKYAHEFAEDRKPRY